LTGKMAVGLLLGMECLLYICTKYIFYLDNENHSPDKEVIKLISFLIEGNLAVWSYTGWLKGILFFGKYGCGSLYLYFSRFP